MTDWRLGIEHRPYNEALRQARVQRGMTRKALAAKVGHNQSSIGRYESLKQWPTTAIADRIALALEEPADVLFPEEVGDRLRGHPAHNEYTSVPWDQVVRLDDPSLRLIPAETSRLSGLPDAVEAVLDSLAGRERRILEMRFGLTGEPMTRKEIAEGFNVTPVRIAQIEAKALRKLRDPSRSKKLDAYVDPSLLPVSRR